MSKEKTNIGQEPSTDRSMEEMFAKSGLSEQRVEKNYGKAPAEKKIDPEIPEKVEKKIEEPSTPKQEEPSSTETSASDSDSPFDDTYEIKEMEYQEPLDMNSDKGIEQQLSEEAGRKTSDFIYEGLKWGVPELGGMLTKIKDDIVQESDIDDNTKEILVKEIIDRNKTNKSAFKNIPEFHQNNIKEPLRQVLEKRGLETSIPPEALLAFGLLMLGIWMFGQIREIKKMNTVYVSRLDRIIGQREKEHKEELREIQDATAALKSQQESLERTKAESVK